MSHLMCEIKGCGEKAEYDVNDTRPFIFHTASDGTIHCAGSNPNNRPTPRSFIPKTVVVKTARDHILQEYYGYGIKKKKTDEEEEEDD